MVFVVFSSHETSFFGLWVCDRNVSSACDYVCLVNLWSHCEKITGRPVAIDRNRRAHIVRSTCELMAMAMMTAIKISLPTPSVANIYNIHMQMPSGCMCDAANTHTSHEHNKHNRCTLHTDTGSSWCERLTDIQSHIISIIIAPANNNNRKVCGAMYTLFYRSVQTPPFKHTHAFVEWRIRKFSCFRCHYISI